TYDLYIAEEFAKEYGVTKVTLEEHIQSADVVSAHVPLNVEIKHMFNLDLFREMKPEGYFINVGRCQLVNEADLVEAIKKKSLPVQLQM
ncbi:MAG TPA: NAD(P)-dependent oxidoreductase, partial [Anaerovoracaceae bacterium]|nr:NAD(P)-dependent oxidoreductase [Anaerovoracaceae bacterium]